VNGIKNEKKKLKNVILHAKKIEADNRTMDHLIKKKWSRL
jgi:hypothetical protein